MAGTAPLRGAHDHERHGVARPSDDEMTDPIAFLQTLIRAQRDGEAAVQRLVAAEARSLGCTRGDGALPARRRADGGRVRQRAGDRCRRTRERRGALRGKRRRPQRLIFFAHPDGEPVAGTERWKRDPFAGIVERRSHPRLGRRRRPVRRRDHDRGPARRARPPGAVPAGDVILASTPSKRHARGVSALLHGGLRADAAVYLHPAESGVGMREIKAFCLGPARLPHHRRRARRRRPTRSAISPSPIRRSIPPIC